MVSYLLVGTDRMIAAFVISRALGEPGLLRGRLRQFRTYLELLFGAPGSDGAPRRADA